MFRTLIYPSSGACDYSVELPHLSYCSWFSVCWSFGVVGLEWHNSACNMDTTPTQPHRNSNTHRTKKNTTNVVIQQNSRKLLMMDIFMSETCWAHKKGNKIASDIKLVFYSSNAFRNFMFLCSWYALILMLILEPLVVSGFSSVYMSVVSSLYVTKLLSSKYNTKISKCTEKITHYKCSHMQ